MKLFSVSRVALCYISFASTVWALTPAQWRAQSVYQVVTDRFARTDGSTTYSCSTADQAYCGGTWQGIIKHLDYIQGMGFTAIWISPVTAQLAGSSLDGSAYHGYWQQDIYSLNSNFGTAADLKALSDALHTRGMQSYFHDFCLIDYNDPTSVKMCWEGDNIVSLPDLRTEDSNVASVWNEWITSLVANYSIDGLRVDSAQQVDNAFFPPFETAAGVYIVGEVFNGDPAYVCPYQESMSGVLNYPTFFWITQAFESTSGSISNLVDGVNKIKSDCLDTTLLGSFLENHDNPRFPSLTSDISLTKNAIAFTMLQDGIPITYYGQEQHYSGGAVPADREALWSSSYDTSATLYTWITALNEIRTHAISKQAAYLTYKAYPVYSDSSTIVMRKGNQGYQTIGVFTNLGASGSSYTLTLTPSETGFTASQALVEVMSCTAYTTDSSGNLVVAMAGGLPRVFYPLAQLTGSGICGITGKTVSVPAGPIPKVFQRFNGDRNIETDSVACLCRCYEHDPHNEQATSCTSTSAAVTFDVLKTTSYGQTMKVSGNVTALGTWVISSAVALDATAYTASNPLWAGTVNLTPGTAVAYKYVIINSDGTATWEADPNRIITVPCAATTVSNTWQS
ncbi:hypothetical protein BP6252_00155 [Coleophoma cylindrospora]|uniref:alpha-amylase n=1 Tax=Coleophoma cylindrospora TaxID=1849047 RepID=A0A3D8SP64_9HELO|nr:hypothetical protein BP6252_00155 [Coleophoma cylindrospora]